MAKIRAKNTLASNVSANYEKVIDLYNYKDFVLLLSYANSSSTTAKLQSSVDYDSDTGSGIWIDVPSSSETFGTDGAVEWRCSGLSEPFIKVVVSGDATGIDLTFAGSFIAPR